MATAADGIAPGASYRNPRQLDEGTLLALTRTRLAAERTLMAWVRTAFAMISFGFTIGKFLQYLAHQSSASVRPGGVTVIPAALIALGLLSLLLGTVEFRRTLTELAAMSGTRHRVTVLGLMVTLVAMLGLLAFAGLFARARFL